MFSSLASLIFGSNTSATTNSEAQNHLNEQRREQQQSQLNGRENSVRIDAENTFNVTSSTPSVAGNRPGQPNQAGKRIKGKRNKHNRNKNQVQKSSTSITKLLTPTESSDEDFNEDDWFIVEKEDEQDSLPRTDSEEELSAVEVKSNNPIVGGPSTSTSPSSSSSNYLLAQRRHYNINSHSLYNGPRPQQQCNFLQLGRNNGARSIVPQLSNTANGGQGERVSMALVTTDSERTSQSLYVTPPTTVPAPLSSGHSSSCGSELGANISMEESWFMTPPPCFTSIGPINMETSPYENLLIEHPSMSVYHSIRSAQEAAESFVNLDLGVGETLRGRHLDNTAAVSVVVEPEAPVTVRAVAPLQQQQQQQQQQQPQQRQEIQQQQQRNTTAHADRFTVVQMKQEILARSSQKSRVKKERQYLNRGAINRSNKARDFQSCGNRQRRSDMQNCKLMSGANNNRKCCF